MLPTRAFLASLWASAFILCFSSSLCDEAQEATGKGLSPPLGCVASASVPRVTPSKFSRAQPLSPPRTFVPCRPGELPGSGGRALPTSEITRNRLGARTTCTIMYPGISRAAVQVMDYLPLPAFSLSLPHMLSNICKIFSFSVCFLICKNRGQPRLSGPEMSCLPWPQV